MLYQLFRSFVVLLYNKNVVIRIPHFQFYIEICPYNFRSTALPLACERRPISGCRLYFSAETSDNRKQVCVRRLLFHQNNCFLCFSNGPSHRTRTRVLQAFGGLTEPIATLLSEYEIRVFNKPFKTLHQEFPSPKLRQHSDLQFNVAYKILCKACP